MASYEVVITLLRVGERQNFSRHVDIHVAQLLARIVFLPSAAYPDGMPFGLTSHCVYRTPRFGAGFI